MYRLSDLIYIILFNLLELALLPISLLQHLFGRRAKWPPERVLIIHTVGIGDLLMATPLLAAMRRAWPGAELVLAVQPNADKITLLEGADCVDRVVELPCLDARRTMRDRVFWKRLAETPFDLAVLCFPFNRPWKLAFVRILGRLKCRGAALRLCASDFRSWSRWIRYYAPVLTDQHRVKTNLSIAERMGVSPVKTPKMIMRVSDEDQAFANRFFEGNDLVGTVVGIHPGSEVNNKFKRWPSEKHIELTRRLHETYACRFVLLQGPDDADAVAPLVDAPTGASYVVLKDATIKQTAAVITRCSLIVNTDGALGHVAAAVGTPTVTIFGPGEPALVRPWGDAVRVVHRKDLCASCLQPWRPLRCNHEFRCVREVSVDAVYEAAGSFLSERTGTNQS